MRDTATQALLDAGFKLLTKDAEPPIEAEGHVQGKYHGQRAGDRAVRRQVAAPVHGLLTMSGAVALQTLIAGLATGAAYGLIALGFTLVHRLTA